MVHLGPDGFYAVEEPSPWKLVKALQELKAENDELRQEVTELRREVHAQ
jgi:cell division protein FtsB